MKRLLARIVGERRPMPAQALEDLGLQPEERDFAWLVPVIISSAAAEYRPGPTARISTLPFRVAWATCGDMNGFFYVNDGGAAYWNGGGIDRRAVAMTNLAVISAERPASGQKDDAGGQPFVKVMLHQDALGPSRLLLPHLFDRELGAGYEVAIPERTCAIAFRRGLAGSEAADIAAMIDGCYRLGTEPMSPGRFDAARFWAVDGSIIGSA